MRFSSSGESAGGSHSSAMLVRSESENVSNNQRQAAFGDIAAEVLRRFGQLAQKEVLGLGGARNDLRHQPVPINRSHECRKRLLVMLGVRVLNRFDDRLHADMS